MSNLARIMTLFEPQFLAAYESYADVKPNRRLTEPYVEWLWPEGADPTDEELRYRYLEPATKALAVVAREGAVNPAKRRLEITIETTQAMGRSLRITLRKLGKPSRMRP